MSEQSFIDKEIAIRKENDINLLVELLYLYYKNDKEFKEKHVLNALHDNVIYEEKEKEILLEEAKKRLSKKYNIKI